MTTQLGAEFKQELLKSEQLRASIVMGLAGVGLIQVTVNKYIFTSWVNEVYKHEWTFFIWIAWFMLFVLIELVVYFRIRQFRKQKREVPAWIPFFNIILEVSLVTGILATVIYFEQQSFFLDSAVSKIYYVLLAMSVLHLNRWICLAGGLVAGIQYLVLATIVIQDPTLTFADPYHGTYMYYWLHAFMLVLTGIATGFVAHELRKRINNALQSHHEQKEVEVLLGQQVSQEVLEALKNEDGSVSKLVKASIMFLDIRNFTPFADSSSPEEVIRFQNRIFDPLIKVIDKHGGIVNQIMGDGFMATFGAPIPKEDHCREALSAGLEILETIQQEAELDSKHPFSVGIGLHTGEVITGNIGNDIRKQFSVAGSTVIIASRVEQLNKTYKSRFLISGSVVKALGGANSFKLIDKVQLKGTTNETEIFKVS